MLQAIFQTAACAFDLFTVFILCRSRFAPRFTLAYKALVLAGGFAAYYFALSQGAAHVLASVCLVTLPALVFFLVPAIYRDARFLFTFCSVFLWSLIPMSLGRQLVYVHGAPFWLGVLAQCAIYCVLGVLVWRVRAFYHMAQDMLGRRQWRSLALLSVLFYAGVGCGLFVQARRTAVENAVMPLLFYLVIAAVYWNVFHLIQEMLDNMEYCANEKVLELQIALQQSRLKEQDLLYRLAYADGLTGLLNRLAFEAMHTKIVDLWDSQLPITCIEVDINNLKAANDTYGHAGGDEMIRGAAEILRHAFPITENVYRIGGDEFIMLLFDTSGQEADDLLCRLYAAADQYNREHYLQVSFAVGAAAAEKGAPCDLDALVRRADEAMYRDKARFHSDRNPQLDPLPTVKKP